VASKLACHEQPKKEAESRAGRNAREHGADQVDDVRGGWQCRCDKAVARVEQRRRRIDEEGPFRGDVVSGFWGGSGCAGFSEERIGLRV